MLLDLRTLFVAISFSVLMIVLSCVSNRQVGTDDSIVRVTTSIDSVTQYDLERVHKEAEKGIKSISAELGTEPPKIIKIKIVDKGIVRMHRGTISLPIKHVKNKRASIVGIISYIIVKHNSNKFFSVGMSVYFQEKYGEDNGFPNFNGEPLDDMVKRREFKLNPLYKLAHNNDIFNQVGTINRETAYIQAGSFFNFLSEVYGETKLRKLNHSEKLDYIQVYGKNLQELEVEWKEFVFQ